MTLFFTFSVFLNKNKGDVTNRGKEGQPSVVPLVFRQTIWTNLSISWSKVFDRYRWHIPVLYCPPQDLIRTAQNCSELIRFCLVLIRSDQILNSSVQTLSSSDQMLIRTSQNPLSSILYNNRLFISILYTIKIQKKETILMRIN